jgi:hypothetical protein
MYIQNRIIVLSLIGVILISMVVVVITINPAQAETGQGDDVFRVIMTIFGVDESKGDDCSSYCKRSSGESKVI